MSNAISAQGTLLARAPIATPTVFTTIAELRDMSGPSMDRNEIETTPHNDTMEAFVLGIRRMQPMTVTIGYLPGDSTHDELTGLMKAHIDSSRDIYRLTFPDGSIWLFSGYVKNITPDMPVDDGLTAEVTIRPTGLMSFA